MVQDKTKFLQIFSVVQLRTSACSITSNPDMPTLVQREPNPAKQKTQKAAREAPYYRRQKQPGLTASNKKRVFVSDDYQDRSLRSYTKEDLEWLALQGKKDTAKHLFPFKLFRALEQAESDGLAHIFSWLEHGRAFKIHNREEFKSLILSRYLGISKYESFLRQCSLYCFRRLTRASGTESSGAMYHQSFLRGRAHLLREIARKKIKGTSVRPAANFVREIDLTSMPACYHSAGNRPLRSAFSSIQCANKTSLQLPGGCATWTMEPLFVPHFEGRPFVLLCDESNDISVGISDVPFVSNFPSNHRGSESVKGANNSIFHQNSQVQAISSTIDQEDDFSIIDDDNMVSELIMALA